MATGNNINEVKTMMPKVRDTFDKYVRLLKKGDVRLEKLVFTKRLSKGWDEDTRDVRIFAAPIIPWILSIYTPKPIRCPR